MSLQSKLCNNGETCIAILNRDYVTGKLSFDLPKRGGGGREEEEGEEDDDEEEKKEVEKKKKNKKKRRL